MMKKILSLLISLLVVITSFSFGGCGQQEQSTPWTETIAEGAPGERYDPATGVGIWQGGDYVFLSTCNAEGSTLYLPEKFDKDITINAVGEGAFSGNTEIESLIVPDCYTLISMFAFYQCSTLKRIQLGSSVQVIENFAFQGCSSVEEVHVSSENPYFYAEGNCIIERSINTLLCGFSSSAIPSGVTKIGVCAFETVDNVRTFEIPSSVTEIDHYAFCNSSIVEIKIPNSVVSIGEEVFSECANLKSIYIPQSVEVLGANLLAGCKEVTIYCEATEEPAGWDKNWLAECENPTVVWGAAPQA